ncbi:uncharacterized protein LOC144507483 [Mustelus asterias]
MGRHCDKVTSKPVIPTTTSSTPSPTPEVTSKPVIPTTTSSTTSPTPEVTTTTKGTTTVPPVTSTTVPTTTTQETTTTSVETATTEVTSKPEKPTTTSSTTSPTPEVTTTTKGTTTVPPVISTTEVVCHGHWSAWINENTPSKDNPGDYELQNPKDTKYCSSPSETIADIQCQFVDQPEKPISQSTDNVTCDKDKGLTCEVFQSATEVKRLCFDYQVRVCCEPVTVVPTTLPPTTSTSVPTTTTQETTTTSVETTTAEVTSKPVIPTTTSSTTSPTPEVITTTVKPTTTSSTTSPTPEVTTTTKGTTTVPPVPSTTEVVCHGHWSAWINENTPSKDNPGDYELQNPKDTKYCSSPSETIADIQCQFVDQPEKPISQSPDNVTCDKDKGLTCEVSQSATEEKRLCFDYQVRVCCEPVTVVPTTLPPTTSTSVPTTTTQETTTTSVETTPTEVTTKPVIPTTTSSTTSPTPEVTTTTKGTTTVPPVTSTTVPTITTQETTTTSVETTTGLVCKGEWSGWFNENTPSISNKNDFELLKPIWGELCAVSTDKISQIECEAVKFPHHPISKTKDNVTCDLEKGLICTFNEEAAQSSIMCLDYRIRVCCEPKPPFTPSTVSPTSAISSTTRGPGCYCNSVPPRKCNETWQEHCSKLTCLSGDIYQIENITCPSLPSKPNCRNGLEPVKVQTKDGCCEQWDCDCECKVWGEPHYRTFDGVQYDFFENCTYILVEEKVPKYNFSILLDNYNCLPTIPKSCPKGLVIFYNGNTLTISTGDQYVLTVNGKKVSFPYSANGFKITKPGSTTHIYIPDIRTSILALRNDFEIKMPEQYFLENTQGQCGACTHSRSKCTRKSGKHERDDCCTSTASGWRVHDPSKPYCKLPTPDPICVLPTPPPTCKPEKTICDIISGKPFEECRKKINLEKYIKTCHFDHCQINSSVDCSSVEAAALACAGVGICVTWRNFTNGECSYQCHQGFIYDACRERGDDSCEDQVVIPGVTFPSTVEGCFCPPGKMLAENNTKCVATCDVCKPMPYVEKIVKDDCEANVEVNRCEGKCFTYTKFNFHTNALTNVCQCCRERDTEDKSVKLKCKNGTTMTYKYIDIKSCICQSDENWNGHFP